MKLWTCRFAIAISLITAGGAYAQSRARTEITRIYAGPDGAAHAEVIEVKTVPRPSPNQSSAWSETFKASGVQFRRFAPGFVNERHPSPQRGYMIGLMGRGEVEVSDGIKVPIEPGRVILFEDLTGKGHVLRSLGTEDCLTAIVAFPESQ